MFMDYCRLLWLAVAVYFGALMFNDAEAAFKKATYIGKPGGCEKGEFWDPRNGGECWSCSKGTRRTAYAVNSAKACVRPAYEKFKKAKKKRKNSRIGQGCPKGQFWDVKGGNGLLGACYTCSGYRRTGYAVTHKKSCAKMVKEKLQKAAFKRKWACKAGMFYDPRKGGQCWTCPRNYFRTVNPVTHAKACTNKLFDVLAADTGLICKGFINAMNKGIKEAENFSKTLKSFTDPVTKPVDDMMTKLSSQVKSPKELDKLLLQMANAMKPFQPVLAEVQRLQEDAKNKKNKLRGILLNADLMCGGDNAKILNALKSASLKPNLSFKKASLLDGLFINAAHAAASEKVFVAFSVSMSGRGVGNPFGPALSYSLVTDFEKHIRHFWSGGATTSYAPGGGYSLGFLIFPKASIDDFNGLQSLGTSFSFSQGETLEKLVKKLPPKVQKVIPAGLTISFDPAFKSVPGFGLDWTLLDVPQKGGNVAKLINFSFTVDGTFAIR
jgi:hypothetical protein